MRDFLTIAWLGTLILVRSSFALPVGPDVLCEVWPDGTSCGDTSSCSPCHTTPPARDDFGADIEARLWPGEERPENAEQFEERVRALLPELEELDSDGDGITNKLEWVSGTDPGDRTSVPMDDEGIDPCLAGGDNPAFQICGYDTEFAFRRASLDLCARSPSWSDLTAFRALDDDARLVAIDELVTSCLKSEAWLGKAGTLRRIAHAKIRPLAALKSGEGAGDIPLGDYEDDYVLFTYVMSGDRDARDLLLANYFVVMTNDNPIQFRIENNRVDQNTSPAERAGMLTTRWFLLINTMFTPIPRTTAAQAYRAYLGLDIAKSEGLIEPIGNELIDYDDKGITEAACATCHRTLDPLSYPFSRYEGIRGQATGSYVSYRLDSFGADQGSRLGETPEEGAIFGQPVRDLIEWSQVAANSDEFAQSITMDLWTYLIGHKPSTDLEKEDFQALWTGFRQEDNYRVERLIQRMIDTHSYGRP